MNEIKINTSQGLPTILSFRARDRLKMFWITKYLKYSFDTIWSIKKRSFKTVSFWKFCQSNLVPEVAKKSATSVNERCFHFARFFKLATAD